MGEEVCASVIVTEGVTITEADIKAYSKGKVSFKSVFEYLNTHHII